MINISLPSIQNIRDLGDTPAAGGSRIRPGCLIRSAHLGYARKEDVAFLQEKHRLDTVIDLRTQGERNEMPDHSFGTPVLRLPILGSFQSGITHEQQQEEQQRIPGMAGLYVMMMTEPSCVEGFRKVLKTIFDHDFSKGAVLWHCTEGKDRCGMTTALVLQALGVDFNTILTDYLETNRTNIPKARAIYERAVERHGEEYAAGVYQAYIADEDYLYAAWDAMGPGYLQRVLGFTDAQLLKFRISVLEV